MLLEIKNLKTGFITDECYQEVLHGIDVSISENEIVGLVGESGCGKTITAYSVLGLLPKNAKVAGGEVIFEGANLLNSSEEELRNARGQKIAMIFQEPFTALNPVIKVGEQIKESVLAHKKIKEENAESMVFELLKKVHIKDPKRLYYDYPHQLSGGQRQRVLIAMALILEPKLLIADEPTTALDVTTQHEILKLLLELKKNMKMSILFITHDFGIISEVANKVLVMKEGVIVERGEKKEILSLPQHPYTKKLLKAVPRIEDTEKEKRTESTGNIIIETKSLSKSFILERGFLKGVRGKVDAVRDLNLVIKEGETLGLVGESGCGKTTVGKLLLGLLKPDGGEILLEGKSLKKQLKDVPYKIRQMMQIVFQDPYGSLDPRMTMGDIVLEGPSILGKKKLEKESILKEVLEKVHMNFTDRFKYPHQFSGGQRQRIAIARALATKARFLILDEPVSSLDVLIQKDIIDLLKSLQIDMELTYLFISHDLRVVYAMSDKIAVMYQGSIVESSSSINIYKNPRHPYTKRLLESIPAIN